MSASTYLIHNSAMATTAAPVKQPTGTAIRSMLQIAPATGFKCRIIEWGCSFDGSAAATPGQVELIETNVAGTLSTALTASDIQKFGDANAPTNSSGGSGIPFNLSTATSAFATAAGTEGSTTTARMFDLQMIAPTNQYLKQFPLGREPELVPGNFLRIRMTFGTTVNAYCYVIIEV